GSGFPRWRRPRLKRSFWWWRISGDRSFQPGSPVPLGGRGWFSLVDYIGSSWFSLVSRSSSLLAERYGTRLSWVTTGRAVVSFLGKFFSQMQPWIRWKRSYVGGCARREVNRSVPTRRGIRKQVAGP